MIWCKLRVVGRNEIEGLSIWRVVDGERAGMLRALLAPRACDSVCRACITVVGLQTRM